jgi:hypothetical protein
MTVELLLWCYDVFASYLFALRWRARGQSERGGNRYSPTFGCLYEDPFGNATRGRVVLGDGVAVRSVHDSRSDWQNSQISGDESVGPRRIAARTPIVESELEPQRSVASKSTRMKVRGEISSAITLVYRVYILFEQMSRLDRIGRGRRWRQRINTGRNRRAPNCEKGDEPGGCESRPCHTSLRKMVPQS